MGSAIHDTSAENCICSVNEFPNQAPLYLYSLHLVFVTQHFTCRLSNSVLQGYGHGAVVFQQYFVVCILRPVKPKMSQELRVKNHTCKDLPYQNDFKLISMLLPKVSDDVLDAIRAIVPPPPPTVKTNSHEQSCNRPSSPFDEPHLLDECLYTRRPTEESLLENVKSPSYSAQEAIGKLEDLFFQLIDPKKYSDEMKLTDCISQIMRMWKEDSALQHWALHCLARLSEQNDDFIPPHSVLNLILVTLEQFPNHTEMFRRGLKILMGQKIYKQLNCKIKLANLVFNALCNMHGVDYFILFAKNIVEDLKPTERYLLREDPNYISMLLDFLDRQNETMTIMLRWCALDVLKLLAENEHPWNIFTSMDGHTKLQKLCQEPEYEDRCKVVLERTVLLQNQVNKSPTLSRSTNEALNEANELLHSTSYEGPQLRNGELSSMIQEKFSQSDKCNGRPNTFSPQHMAMVNIGRKQNSHDEIKQKISYVLSAPPKVLEVCDQFISEDWMTNKFFHNRNGVNMLQGNVTGISDVKESCESIKKFSRNVVVPYKSEVVNDNLPKCFICKEPKGKQPLLVKQFKQIAHCLHQPSNLLLFNCLEANICENHRV